ncbi:MAG TPA: lantibiotic dehydratase C-terminal domain-containing protein [Thermoanaerobaculia bacterium]
MTAARPAFPDPVLTANIYGAGLDAALFGAVAPFWRELRTHDPERLCYLWVMRYDRRGEHLKVRVHGPESLLPLQRELLAAKTNAFLAALPEPAESPAGPGSAGPPIDPEDAGAPLDRALLWTTYRRSHISLGGKPFLDDDRYAALLTRCLAGGCDLMLALEPGPGGSLSSTQRRNTLVKALIEGLAALGFPAAKRADYLAYHRDWLLRLMVPKHMAADPESSARLRNFFDAQIARMEGSLAALGRIAAAAWDGGERALRSPQEVDPVAGWRRSLAGLLAHVSPLCLDPDYRLEPFASDPVFAPVFKVFHGVANQLGLKRQDEAFTHHLLLRATAAGPP